MITDTFSDASISPKGTPNHKIRTYRKNYAVFSVLEVIFNDEEVQRASYRCIGNNSMGATTDSVDIHLLGKYDS